MSDAFTDYDIGNVIIIIHVGKGCDNTVTLYNNSVYHITISIIVFRFKGSFGDCYNFQLRQSACKSR